MKKPQFNKKALRRRRDPLSVAFQGEPGAFSEAAAHLLLGKNIKPIPCLSFDEIFEGVNRGKYDRAIVPIENSLVGSIHKNYDLLLKHRLPIVNEIYLRIVHNLIGHPQAKLKDLKQVFSHQVALGQCLRFFKSYPGIEAIPAFDTAGSVKMILTQKDRTQAAIASANAAQTYGGKILLKAIEDHHENYTRFLLITRPDTTQAQKKPRSPIKTSLVYELQNEPGALFKSLAVFALRDIDLKKIESRPLVGKPWQYLFYVDILGDPRDPKIEKALSHLSEITSSLQILGSYPMAALPKSN